jgi:hypothetical protein
MGAARLLAKGWIVFCLYVGALALGGAQHAIAWTGAGGTMLVCLVLFGAMGILFIAGYGLSSAHFHPPLLARLQASSLLPGFTELVFIAFALILLLVQLFASAAQPDIPPIAGLEAAIRFGVFGQRALETALAQCRLGSDRLFVSALSWTLALVLLGSALSRIRLAATVVRFERKRRPETLGAQPLAFALGLVSVAGIQLLFMGTGYTLLPCRALGSLFGDAMIAIGPPMLAYLIVAALTNLLTLGPEA